MDEKKIGSILRDALEEEIPSSEVKLWPAIQARLGAVRKPLGQQGKTTRPVISQRLSRVVLIALILSTLMSVALITPQGRAFAQKIFHFFTVTEEKSFPIPTEQVFSIPSTETPIPTYVVPLETVGPAVPAMATQVPDGSCASREAQSTHFCQIQVAEAQAGFDAKEFPYDPRGTKFSQAVFNSTAHTIEMEFVVITGGGSLYLRQGMGEFPSADKWGEVPADAIEQVIVKGQYAEFVSGAFVVYPNSTEAVWEPRGPLLLRWQEGDRWFSLEKMGDPYSIEWIGEKEMVELAESLVDERPWDATPPVDPENLTSVEAVEVLAGFEVPSPTFLPVGHELKRVAWRDGVVHLLYGPQNSGDSALMISMGRVENSRVGPCFECPPGAVEEVQIGPWKGWYIRGAFNMGLGSNVDPTPTPVWEPNALRGLQWNTDTLWFSISYFSSSDYGGEMNRETMIKIAENLK